MITANINTIYKASKVYSGESSKGKYELIVLEGASRNDRLPIWVKNIPCNVEAGMEFVIAHIESVNLRHIKPNDKYDKWQDEYSINATVMPVNA